MTNIVKVKFNRDEMPFGRDYTYLTPVCLKLGDLVEIEAKNGIAKGTVTQVNVPASEIEAFKHAMKNVIRKIEPEEKGELKYERF